jgi:hypothetical protein
MAAWENENGQLTITLTLGLAARMALSMVVYESMMDWALRLPMLTSLVPSMNCTMSGLVFCTQPTMLFRAMSYACQPEWPSWLASNPDGFEHDPWTEFMLPTKSTLPASPAAVSWSHTIGRQQVISVMESPRSTVFLKSVLCSYFLTSCDTMRGPLTDFDLLAICRGRKASDDCRTEETHGYKEINYSP